jgi:futalosine hydrolase
MILLLAATPVETPFWRSALPERSELPGGFCACRGKVHGQELVLVLTGVGKANAASASTAALMTYRPELVINFGCAGAFPQAELALGDLVLASEEIFGDEGVATPETFLDLEKLGLPLLARQDPPLFNRLSLASSWLSPARDALSATSSRRRCQWRSGPVVTVSTGSGNRADSDNLRHRTGALCENMEGSAIALVCHRFATEMVEIRGISNWTGDRDPAAWDLPLACSAAEEACNSLIEHISRQEPSP